MKVLVSIMMSVSLSNRVKPLKLRHYDISRAHFQGTAQRLIYIRLPAEDRQKYGEDKVGRLVKSMYGTQDASHIWHGELGGFRRGKHRAALFHNTNQGVRMAMQGDFEYLVDDDGLKHINTQIEWQWMATTLCVCQTMMDSNTSTVFSNPNTQRKTWEHLDSKIQT